jgi:hypothetical protein
MTMSEAGKLGALKTRQIQIQQVKERIESYNQNPTKCLFCDTSFPYEKRHNKFCNKSCAASFNNKGKIKNYVNGLHSKLKPNNDEKKLIIKSLRYCLFCNEIITGHPRKKYCNSECFRNTKREDKKNEFLKIGCTNGNTTAYKKFLIELKGHQCEICKNIEWMSQPIPLIMDHIDGNSENGKLDNMRLVCGNCDMQLPTYKSKNKGNGRAWRRKRYAEGKSY